MREKGCHTIQAEEDADLDVVKAAVAMSELSTTLIGEDTDLLVWLLYHAAANDCKDLYFRSDKGKPNVYNIKVLTRLLLGDDVCSDLFFIHAFSGCDTTSRIFGMGKKSVVQKVIAGDSVLHEYSKVFCTPTADPATVETSGCDAMVSLFNGGKSDSLASLRYSFLAEKVATAKTFVTPERLPQQHRQQILILGGPIYRSWNGWARMTACNLLNGAGKLMMKYSPAPNSLLKMVHCNCSSGCSTMRCGCRKHALECTRACSNCQNGDCDNMAYKPVSDDEDEA